MLALVAGIFSGFTSKQKQTLEEAGGYNGKGAVGGFCREE
jgi:hypothetical protein